MLAGGVRPSDERARARAAAARALAQVFQRVQVGDDPLLVYREDLEKSLVKAAERYFQGKAAEWIAVDSVPDYLRKAEAALAAESERVHVRGRVVVLVVRSAKGRSRAVLF